MNDKTLEELRYYFNGYGSRHEETILKLIDQNKLYREAIVGALDAMPVGFRNESIRILGKALEDDV